MFPGFNNKKRSSVSRGDWDRDGVTNLKDCNAMNWKKQDGGKIGIGDPAFVKDTDDLVIIKGESGDSFIVDNNVNEYKIKKSKLRSAY